MHLVQRLCKQITNARSAASAAQGRAACEIDTADELLATELLLNGVFSELDEHLLAALASTLIPQEKTQVCRLALTR